MRSEDIREVAISTCDEAARRLRLLPESAERDRLIELTQETATFWREASPGFVWAWYASQGGEA